MKHKLTGNITQDIDIVFDAVSYVTQLVDGLVEEELLQNKSKDNTKNNDHTKVQIHMSDLKKMMHFAEETAKQMRQSENEYRFGPLSKKWTFSINGAIDITEFL